MGKLFKQNSLYVFIQRTVYSEESRFAPFQVELYFRGGRF